MLGTSFGNVELTEGAKDLYRETGLTKLQEFYGLSFKEMFDEKAMKAKWVKDKDKKYILEHREVEFARRETESFEMRMNLFKEPRWKELKEKYGIHENDIRNEQALRDKWLSNDDIGFIMWQDIKDKAQEDKWEVELSLDEMKLLLDDAGIKYHHASKEPKLLELLKENKLLWAEKK